MKHKNRISVIFCYKFYELSLSLLPSAGKVKLTQILRFVYFIHRDYNEHDNSEQDFCFTKLPVNETRDAVTRQDNNHFIFTDSSERIVYM